MLFPYPSLAHPEDYTEVAVIVAGAADAKVANLARVLHVCSEAGTYVIVAHVDETQGFAGIGRQFAQVDALGHFITRHVA